MSNQQSVSLLKNMKLPGMCLSLEEQLSQPNTYHDLSFLERLNIMIDREQLYRENTRFKRLLKQAKFKIPATIEEIDYQHPRGLTKDKIVSLLNKEWLSRHQNLLFTGPTGCGKTYLACAIGHHACKQGLSVRYYRANRLFEALTIAHGDGSYGRFIQALAKTKLLIIDDWGLEQLSPSQRTDLLEIMEDRHNVSSTLVTSQVPTIHWHECIGDPTLADAILDRLIHNAHKFSLKGESMRKNENNLTGIDQ
ncbi:MAG: IS21-like element helper ATPase IstB [Pseudomonadota bacterium]|nr:IS21-like element helper ATPase IstB [Pseudomonadota bacterium]